MNKILLATMISFSLNGLAFASSDRSDYNHSDINQQIMENRKSSANVKSIQQLTDAERAVLFRTSLENGSAQAHQNIAMRHMQQIENNQQVVNKTGKVKSIDQLTDAERAVLIRQTLDNGSAQAHENIARRHMQ